MSDLGALPHKETMKLIILVTIVAILAASPCRADVVSQSLQATPERVQLASDLVRHRGDRLNYEGKRTRGGRLRWDRGDFYALAGLLTCQAADAATTFVVLSQGGHEINPILPDNKWGIVGVKVGLTLVAAGLSHLMPSHTTRRVMMAVAGGPSCAAAVWNGTQIK